MMDDTRSWRKEKNDGEYPYICRTGSDDLTGRYVDSVTARRRLKKGRAEQARSRPLPQRAQARDTEEEKQAVQGISRINLESSQPAAPPGRPTIRHGQTSAPDVHLAAKEQTVHTAVPSQRPASAQPAPNLDPRQLSAAAAAQHGAVQPGYLQQPVYSTHTDRAPTVSASYTQDPRQPISGHGHQESTRSRAPKPGEEDGGGGGTQPDTTGTQGFNSMPAVSSNLPKQKASKYHSANQGRTRHG